MQSHRDDGEAAATGAEGPSFSHGDHVVLFYRDDDELARRVGEFVLQAGYNGGSAIVITTAAHLRLMEDWLVSAAIELEAMWNELGSQYPMSLFCAYPAQAVRGEQHEDALAEVCRAHTAVIGE
jgi:hypothetical protein